MKTYLDCYPCIVRQTINALKTNGATEKTQVKIMKKVLSMLIKLKSEATPPEISYKIHSIIKRESGLVDPYRNIKSRSTKESLKLYPHLKRIVSESKDQLETAIRISIAGNIIDLGVRDHYEDLSANLDRVLKQPFYINNLPQLKKRFSDSDKILFLADNAGETVFDRVLIEHLSLPSYYAVKEEPIINDATMTDAKEAGLENCAHLISNGTSAPGTILSMCSQEFLDIFNQSKLIIAKGQANYESLSCVGSNVFFLLQVKCPVLGKDLNAPVNSIVVAQAQE